MRIMNAAGTQIFECDYIRRYTLSDCGDAVLVKAGYETDAATLGKYANMNEAKDAIAGIFQSLNEHKEYHIMPDSILRYKQQEIKDARVKRRGGS